MNKKLIGIFVTLILLGVVLSGCNESNVENDIISGDTDKVEIVDYKIETFEDKPFVDDEKIADGFAYNKIDKVGYYNISGKVKNIAGEILEEVNIEVKFYDKNSTYLYSETAIVENLANTYTENFSVKVNYFDEYFKDIDNIKFEIEAS